MNAEDDEKYLRARDLVMQYGWNTTCFQIVNPGLEYWFGPDGRSVVAYVATKHFRVVAGAPVCPVEVLPVVFRGFEADAAGEGKRVCYFGAERRLETAIGSDPEHAFVLLGAQPVWEPKHWTNALPRRKNVRSQINRARNKGVAVEEWPVERAENNPELKACLEKWFELKGLPPLHFVIEPETLNRLEHRRIFVATRGEEVVGFLNLSPIPTRHGWLTEQFPHTPAAPNGTVELMMHTAITQLADEGFEYVTLGLSPLSRRANIEPFDNPAWLKVTLAWMRKHGERFYNFDGLDFLKAKLGPDRWEPVFAISNEPEFSGSTLYAIARAFTNDRPFRVFIGGLAKAARSEMKTFTHWLQRPI